MAGRSLDVCFLIAFPYADTGVEMTYEERQRSLSADWGFKCTCDLCSSAPEAIRASDERRDKIRKLKADALKKGNKRQFRWAIDLGEEMMATVADEDLTSHFGDFNEVLASLYYAVGDMKRADKYTRLALHEMQHYGIPGPFGLKKIDALNGLLEEISHRL